MSERKRFTENRDGINVIPLRIGVCGVDMPFWEIRNTLNHGMFLSGDAADKLARYEEAEADGRLIVPPCKVGDMLYEPFPSNEKILEYKVLSFSVREAGLIVMTQSRQTAGLHPIWGYCIGETHFLTREEAEAALKEKSANNG